MELNNLDQSGKAAAAEMDDRNRQICDSIKPGLIEQGIFFCGIDVISGRLMEVSITCPTCLQELCRFSGISQHPALLELLSMR